MQLIWARFFSFAINLSRRGFSFAINLGQIRSLIASRGVFESEPLQLAAKQNGRVGGRPSSLKEKDIAVARTLLQDPSITVEEVAKRMQVAPSTLYRYFQGGRSSVITNI